MNAVIRNPEVIASEINVIKSQTAGMLNAALTMARRSCFEIGKRLVEAKAIVGHGNWSAWLEENVGYSESTAGNLMRIFREMGDEQVDALTGKSPAEIFEGLSQSQLVELFALPQTVRAEFVEARKDEIAEMSVRELREEIAREKARADKAEQDAQDWRGKAEDTSAGYDDLLHRYEHDKAADAEEILSLRDELAAAQQAPAEISEDEKAKMLHDALAEARVKQKAEIEALQIRFEKSLKKERNKAEQEAQRREDAARQEGAEAVQKAEEAAREAAEDAARARKEAAAAAKMNDAHGQKIAYAMTAVQRALMDAADVIAAMETEEPGSGRVYKRRCAALIGRIMDQIGWEV